MKLIGSITSPYVRKVRIVMAEKKLDYQFVNEDVWSDGTNISESNPLGQSAMSHHGRRRGFV
jgi:glutathione S-transferase